MKIFYFISCLLVVPFTYSQTFDLSSLSGSSKNVTVSGRVIDSTKQALPYVNILFSNVDNDKIMGTSTDEEGKFTIEIASGNYQITLSSVGYSTIKKKYRFSKDTLLDTFILFEHSKQLNEIVIKADIEKSIEHSAIGTIFNVKNNSLYKNISIAEVLALLPGVQISDNGGISLEGKSAKVTINGKTKKLSSQIISMLLQSLQGDQIESIELINTPSAKYSGKIQKAIDIKLIKQRNDGLLGNISMRIANVDFSIRPSAILNYKTGKFVFSATTSPTNHYRRTQQVFSNSQLLDNSLSFKNEGKNRTTSNRSNNSFGIDYTINKQHSIWGSISVNNSNVETESNLNTLQFASGNLRNTQRNATISSKLVDSYNADFGYQYTIGTKGKRLDFSGNYGENKSDNNNANTNTIIDDLGGLEAQNKNRNNQDLNNEQFSMRLDYMSPLKEKKGNFETGVKYDDLSITNQNIFENFNATATSYELDSTFSNSFKYQEQVYTAYMSLNSNYKKLKYSIGLRLEHVETQSFSITTKQVFNNTFTNFLPVIALKYMTNEKQTSNVSLSYRKGYNLPEYIQLNPFEIFINSNTIQRGNPNLSQNIYHLFRFGYTIKNKYFLSFGSNFYTNQFETTRILDHNITVLSTQNLGSLSSYVFHFNTHFIMQPWWALSVDTEAKYSILKSERVNNDFVSFYIILSNNITLPHKFRLSINPFFFNGESSGFNTPNSFIRVQTNMSLSRRFLKNKASLRVGVSDIFGVANKNEDTYILDNTSFSTRVVQQNPIFSFNFSYRFSSGKKINKKNKKKSGVNDSRF